MKRILQLSNYYYPEIGGIEKIAQAISDAVKEEYDVKVICFTHKKDSKTNVVDGVEIIRCGTQLIIASQQLSFHMPKIIKEQIASFNPDIIILHAPNPFLEAILLRYISKRCKLVVYWHSDIVKQRIGNFLVACLTNKLLKRADTVIATSPNYIDGSYFLNKYRSKCTVVPNCIDENQLFSNEEKVKEIAMNVRNNNVGKYICLCVGRQVPYKGFEYAIRAVNSLDERFILYILGREGESTKELKSLSGNSVIFLGEVDDDTLHAYMIACDIFCFPSITKNEAFGIALAEGMYFGKPAVTFTIPGSGVNYVNLKDVTGLEIENRNSKAYAEAIKRLAEDEFLRTNLGNAAKRRVEENFTSKSFSKNISRVLTETVKV